ncbi:MAG: hypothetical protein JNL41_03370 [Phenylobacterium sp.]|uniref:hypothetical protein n=1 Tax=Phenylobacterium sp. TaxID=1871053 RepID=UPI001A5E2CEC|nr:hypothetical protein [Phenylobacterium sp.]MBL8553293.1 hypothetical protein [Phenylobacterium sp.]
MTASKGGFRDGRWRLAMWGGAAALLLAPAVAMQVTGEVNWGREDFAVFAGMLIGACGAFEVAAWMTPRPAYRIAAGLVIAAIFVLIWAQLAVGVF